MVSPFMPEPEKLAAIRAALPATGAGIYLNAGTAGPLPAETQRAMDEESARELATGRAHPDFWPETQERMAEARAAVAAALVADPRDIALTHSTTDGLNVAVGALPWAAGDRVITTTDEHPGGLGPLLVVRDRLGVELVRVGVEGDDDDVLVARVEAELERGARALALSHVLWTTGRVLPIARLRDAARRSGALVVVDGAQAAGAIPVALDELDVDAYALPAQKWLLGPEGMGALRLRPSFVESFVPPAGGWLSYATFDWGAGGVLHADARRFEATTFHLPSLIGFARSCGWLTMYVGLPWALERAAGQARGARSRLSAIPGVTLLTPPGPMATLVSFRIDGWPSHVAVEELGTRVFAIVREVPPLDAVRISVGFWTTDEELDRFASAVELLARHTPQSIPRRPPLAILGSDGSPLA